MKSRLLLSCIAGAALALPASAQTQMQDRAVRVCQDNIRNRAMNQFGTDEIRFDQINTNRSGWINGMVRVGEGQGAQEHRFSCSVNFDNGYVRSARIENEPVAYANRENREQRYGEAGRDRVAAGVDGCRAVVADRIRDQGYRDIRINSLNADPDGDRISGFARADGMDHPESFSFSCMLDPDTGAVRSTNVTRR